MNENIIKQPKEGTTCPALTNEDYGYHLSGDCLEYCHCLMNGKKCIGRIIEDFDDQSSIFFSRAKCAIDTNKIKGCPMYGISKETFIQILKDKTEIELNDKIKKIGS